MQHAAKVSDSRQTLLVRLPLGMDILPAGNIFRELQAVHDTGFLSAQPSLEEKWQQVSPVTSLRPQRLIGGVWCVWQTVLEMERYLKDEPKVVRMYSVDIHSMDIHSIPAGSSIFKELKAVQSVQQMEELLEEKWPKLSRRTHKCQYEA